MTPPAARRRLNIGLIGLGRLGRVYARDLATRIPETRLPAVADVSPGLAAQIAEEFDVAEAFQDPREMIASPRVDAVVIVSPTHTHKDLAIAALERGKPVFCEKPLALSLA